MSRLALPLLVLLAAPVASAETPTAVVPSGARVELPLGEYEKLRQATERPSLTVVDTLRLTGSFKGGDLRVVFVGRAAGQMPSADVLRGGEGLALFACDGEALLSRGESGFRLTPLATRFSAQCRLATRGSDRLELRATPTVLWIESSVSDGELVLGAAEHDGARAFTVVRRTTSAADGLAPSATARYRITLRPEETRFLYHIDVRNPNRSRTPFTLTLASGEHVQQVDAAVPYDVSGARYRFDLPPGDLGLELSGSLPGTAFTPPLDASVQYLLLEAHPLLRPAVAGEPRRVSPQEVGGAGAGFRGAQAFLLRGAERIEWTVTRLDVRTTTGVAVKRAEHVFFLAADGWARGESTLTLDNQGASGITLPMDAHPTYVGLNGEDLPLTSDPKDPQKDLWVSMGMGEQGLVVQHERRFTRRLGLAGARLRLPRLPTPASYAHVEVRYPEEWVPIAWSFLSRWEVWTPDAWTFLGWLLLCLWAERSLAFLGLRRGRRWLVAGLLAVAASAWGELALVVVVGALAVTGLWALTHLRRMRSRAVVAVLVLLVGGVLLVVLIAVLLTSRSAVSPFIAQDYSERAAPGKVMPSSPVERKAEALEGGTYQGLPVKIDLPYGTRRASFSREMLAPDVTHAATIVMASRDLVWWLMALVALAALALLWRARLTLRAGWQERVTAWRSAGEGTGAQNG